MKCTMVKSPRLFPKIPAGFVRDWLAFHDQRVASEQFLWRAAVLVLGFVAATAAVFGALR